MHFRNSWIYVFGIFSTLQTIWFHFYTYMYYFKLLLIVSLCLITSLIPIFLPSSIKLTFSASLLWLFIIPMLSFNSQYFFSLLIIVSKFLWLILLSMLFDLLLASITILLCFSFSLLIVFKSFSFLLLIVFRNFFTNPDVIENVRP